MTLENTPHPLVVESDARKFHHHFADRSIDLILTDPPYGNISKEAWDKKWKNVPPKEYAEFFVGVLALYRPKLKENASIIFFGGTGEEQKRYLLHLILAIEESEELSFTFRQWITWGKRRGYGKSHDYLYTREEILWYSMSEERTNINFNKPYLSEKRGYPGFDKDYPALSEYKRVTNVWTDIPELFKTERDCEKPVPLMERLVLAHSNPGQLIVDPFCGTGTTGVAALKHGRKFLGADDDPEAVAISLRRLAATSPSIGAVP